MSIAFHKATVRRYFEEALDQRKLDILDQIVTRDCIIHRPETNEPIRGLDSFKPMLGEDSPGLQRLQHDHSRPNRGERPRRVQVDSSRRKARRMDQSARSP
jgi:hypothetical protein